MLLLDGGESFQFSELQCTFIVHHALLYHALTLTNYIHSVILRMHDTSCVCVLKFLKGCFLTHGSETKVMLFVFLLTQCVLSSSGSCRRSYPSNTSFWHLKPSSCAGVRFYQSLTCPGWTERSAVFLTLALWNQGTFASCELYRASTVFRLLAEYEWKYIQAYYTCYLYSLHMYVHCVLYVVDDHIFFHTKYSIQPENFAWKTVSHNASHFFYFVKKYPCFDQTHNFIRLTEVASQKIGNIHNKHVYFLWTPNRFLDHSSHLSLVR